MNRILFILTLLCLSHQSTADPDTQQQRLDDVHQQIKELHSDLTQKKADKDKLYQQLKQQSKTISSLKKKQGQLAAKINGKKKELAQLQRKHGFKQQQQQQQLDNLYAQIKSAYVQARPGYLKLLLNQQDISTLSRSTIYYRYFHQARQLELAQINKTLKNLHEQQHDLLSAQSALESLYDRQYRQQALLQAQAKKRNKTLQQIELTITSQDARLAALKKQAQALQTLLHDLRKNSQQFDGNQHSTTYRTAQPFSRLTGKLPWPVSGKLLARFGSPRKLGTLKWQGIMIASPTGNSIRASAAGKVIFADWLRGFGLLIIIDHGEQYMTLYGNNDVLLKNAGDLVHAGEEIAQSGKQGLRGLAGLYFEIRHKGNPTNPLKWLQRKG